MNRIKKGLLTILGLSLFLQTASAQVPYDEYYLASQYEVEQNRLKANKVRRANLVHRFNDQKFLAGYLIFNEEGQLSRSVHYQGNDSVVSTYIYSDEKWLAEKKTHFSGNEIVQAYAYEFGILKEEILAPIENIRYEVLYDERGRLIEKRGAKAIPKEGGGFSWIPKDTWTYAWKDEQLVTRTFSEKGTIRAETHFKYNDMGLVAEEVQYSPGPTGSSQLQFEFKVEFVYDSQTTLLKKMIHTLTDGSVRQLEYEYKHY